MDSDPKELFVAALWDPQTWQAWDVWLKKKKKIKLFETYFIRDGVATLQYKDDGLMDGGKNHETNEQIMFRWKASGLIYCQKGRRFMFVNNPTPSSC